MGKEKVNYSPANGTEFGFFLENNCFKCSNFNIEMMHNREINDCDILFKLLEQQALEEEDFPELYTFEPDELDASNAPAICLKRKEGKPK